MMRATRDAVPWIRKLALQVLFESSSPKGAEAIRLARIDRDAEVRAWAEEVLRNAGSRP